MVACYSFSFSHTRLGFLHKFICVNNQSIHQLFYSITLMLFWWLRFWLVLLLLWPRIRQSRWIVGSTYLIIIFIANIWMIPPSKVTFIFVRIILGPLSRKTTTNIGLFFWKGGTYISEVSYCRTYPTIFHMSYN